MVWKPSLLYQNIWQQAHIFKDLVFVTKKKKDLVFVWYNFCKTEFDKKNYGKKSH